MGERDSGFAFKCDDDDDRAKMEKVLQMDSRTS